MKWLWYILIACAAYILEFVVFESHGIPLLILYPVLTTLIGTWEDGFFVTFLSGLLYASMTFISVFMIWFALLVIVVSSFLIKRYLFSHFSLITTGITTYGVLVLFYVTIISTSDLMYRVGIAEIYIPFTQAMLKHIITVGLIGTVISMIIFAIIAKFTKILNTAFIVKHS